MKNKTVFFIIGMILIIILIIFWSYFVFLVPHAPYIDEAQVFCESKKGTYAGQAGCLIPNGDSYIIYSLNHDGGYWKLVK